MRVTWNVRGFLSLPLAEAKRTSAETTTSADFVRIPRRTPRGHQEFLILFILTIPGEGLGWVGSTNAQGVGADIVIESITPVCAFSSFVFSATAPTTLQPGNKPPASPGQNNHGFVEDVPRRLRHSTGML